VTLLTDLGALVDPTARGDLYAPDARFADQHLSDFQNSAYKAR
jgi:hypothetical protein